MILQNKINIAIFASGRGSNAINIINTVNLNCTNINIKILITDKIDAKVIDSVRDLNTPYKIFEFEKKSDETYKEAKIRHERKIIDCLKELEVEIILLAGYMRILSKDFLECFLSKICKRVQVFNIHPSLLPDFKGLDAYDKAYKANVQKAGATIHIVDSGVDTGEILLQKSFLKTDGESLSEFKAKGLKTEHSLYRDFLELLNDGKQFINLRDYNE